MSYLKKTGDREKLIKEAEYEVSAFYRVDIKLFYGKSRYTLNSHARFAVWYVLHIKKGLSFSEIARVYNRHPSTILDGVKKAKNLGIAKEMGK